MLWGKTTQGKWQRIDNYSQIIQWWTVYFDSCSFNNRDTVSVIVRELQQDHLKGGVGNFGETSSSALEFENTQPEKICHFLTEPLLQHTRTSTWPMRARDKFVHRWKADRQVGHPVILAGPAKMIGRTFYSTTASTDDIFLWIFCQST